MRTPDDSSVMPGQRAAVAQAAKAISAHWRAGSPGRAPVVRVPLQPADHVALARREVLGRHAQLGMGEAPILGGASSSSNADATDDMELGRAGQAQESASRERSCSRSPRGIPPESILSEEALVQPQPELGQPGLGIQGCDSSSEHSDLPMDSFC